ncbi:MAG: FeoB small GTPase domain-containing protein, partial [Tepidisphaeraceae bacterium]
MSLLAPDLRLKTIALAGNPNSGKTTLFNALTGLKQKVANYPGVTVEKKTGRCTLADGSMVDVIDLPGAYSIISRSPDERVTMQVLRGLRKDTAAPDVVIAVVDASNLSRNLYLVSQLIELGRPMVVALNMMDIAQRRGIRVSAQLLQEQLGVPVIPVTAARGEGVAELKAALAHAVPAPRPLFDLPVPMREQITELARSLHHEPAVVHQDPHVLAERLLIHDESDDLQSLRKSPRLKSLI